jgi:hypothetical protein
MSIKTVLGYIVLIFFFLAGICMIPFILAVMIVVAEEIPGKIGYFLRYLFGMSR